jgi:hypothetical protein
MSSFEKKRKLIKEQTSREKALLFEKKIIWKEKLFNTTRLENYVFLFSC